MRNKQNEVKYDCNKLGWGRGRMGGGVLTKLLYYRVTGLDKQIFECVRQRTLYFNSVYAISRTAYTKYNQCVP